MASNYWIKMWIESLDDPKMGRLSDNLWRRFWECCLLAGEVNQDGRLPPVHDIAWRLRVEEETLRAEFDQLARVGLLDYVSSDPLDNHWIVTSFAKRQSKMSAAERMRRKREHDKKRKYYENGYTPVTDRNTDTDTDTDTDNRYRQLLTAFTNISKLPIFGNVSKRDNEALLSWVEADIQEEDIQAAWDYTCENDLSVVGPASISKGVMIAKSKRLRAAPKSTADILRESY